ncbi:hypothetical protein [Saccharopolyspora mangrovi]|uniref:DUF4229 domain-containing protein n=1 Tax=Saccharopolyspora mangrovi TaxID=3082379 RepID=A0ABU6ALK4_9PSEU|nr:hypothetical protein [Saccharopolyspora sp. S2-29]MEB3372431.1 hypothetical protein [Saccharopolyspora sp. S2-29]
MWLFWIVFQILILVLVGGLVRAGLRQSDDVVTAVIDRIRNTTPPPAVDTAPEESAEDSDESQ